MERIRAMLVAGTIRPRAAAMMATNLEDGRARSVGQGVGRIRRRKLTAAFDYMVETDDRLLRMSSSVPPNAAHDPVRINRLLEKVKVPQGYSIRSIAR